MKRSIVTAAAREPETIANLRAYCRVDSHEEDSMFASLLQNARESIEEHIWRRLITQTWDQYFDEFSDPMRLELSPVQSITSIQYLDSNGTLQTLSTDIYELGDESGIGIVRRQYNQSWPSTYGVPDAVIVRHVVGYGDKPEDAPLMIRAAIRIHVNHFYKRCEETLPQQYYDCLSPLSARRFL